MANLVVTGGSGFIGSNLVSRLLEQGHWVYYTGKKGENRVSATYLGPDFHKIDFAKLPPVELVFHQAAITDTLVTDRQEMFRVNVENSLLLFERAKLAGCKGVVYASSCAVYGNVPVPFLESGPFRPLNAYADSKLALDLHAPCCVAKDFFLTGLRYSNVYGPGEQHKKHASSMIYQMIMKVKAGQKPRLFKWGQQARDFVNIQDVIDLNLSAGKAGISGVFNGGSGEAWSFNDVFKIIKEKLNSDLEIEYIENEIASSYQDLTMCDMTKTEARLGYAPKVSMQEGISQYIDSLDDNGG